MTRLNHSQRCLKVSVKYTELQMCIFICEIVEIPAYDVLSSLLSGSDDGNVDEMENMVSELTEISDSVHFTPCDIESDGDGEFKLIRLL